MNEARPTTDTELRRTPLQRCVDAIYDEYLIGPAERSFGKHRGITIAREYEWAIPWLEPKHRAEERAS